MSLVSDQFIDWFRLSAPYINKHRNNCFVIALPGDAVMHANFTALVQDFALLTTLGIRIVLVHGARAQIKQALNDNHIKCDEYKGRRVTSTEAMPHVIAATSQVGSIIQGKLSASLPNSALEDLHLRVVSGNFITARPFGIRDGIDFQQTGVVRHVDANAILDATANGAIALISTLGYSITGELFNVSLSELALAVGSELHADKLVAFSATADIEQLEKSICSPSDILHLEDSTQDFNYMIGDAAKFAAASGKRAHIVSYEQNGALLKELYSHTGNGVLIQNDPYESIRSATIEDIGSILQLIEPLEKAGILRSRSKETLEQEIQHFFVDDMDGLIVGTGALLPIKDSQAAEIACIAVDKQFSKQGRASGILKHIEQHAKTIGKTEIFALTTQTQHWFIERGYELTPVDTLPNSQRAKYNLQRNSSVLIKTLA